MIATTGTALSGAYPRAVGGTSSRVEVFQQAAPLLVPLVEEGWLDGDVPRLAVRRYLAPLGERDIDALVLGCTHYPLLATIIREEAERAAGHPVTVVDSAHATAEELRLFLDARELRSDRNDGGGLRLLVTDCLAASPRSPLASSADVDALPVGRSTCDALRYVVARGIAHR